MNTLSLQRQFTTSSHSNIPFNPMKPKPKTAKVYLNSTDKMSGTNAKATFKINLPTEFTTQNLGLTMTNFIPVYPTGTDQGIVQVNLSGVENPHSYSSSNQTTHRSLGMIEIVGEGKTKEYPPASLTANTSTLSNQSYGNGVYTASMSSTQNGSAFQAFNKTMDGDVPRTLLNSYNFNTGLYAGSFSTTISGSNYQGEHLTITLPHSIVLSHYDYTSTTVTQVQVRTGNTWVVGGSTDGSNWNILDKRSNVFWENEDYVTKRYTLSNNTAAYNWYRMVTTRVGNSNRTQFREMWAIGELRLFGYSNINPISRNGQSNMNNEIITTDKTIFNRPITVSLSSPTGLDLSTLCNWSAELTIVEKP